MENKETGSDDEDSTKLTFRILTLGPGRLSKKTHFTELNKLKILLDLELPTNLFFNVPTSILTNYRLRTTSEDKTELLRHPDSVRYTFTFCIFFG